MAEHPDIVDDVIATSTDAEPPSRRKVVSTIKTRTRDNETAAARDDDRRWAEGLRSSAGSTADEDRERQQIRMEVRAVCRAVHALAARGPRVSWALLSSPEHVAGDLIRDLDQAARQFNDIKNEINLWSTSP